MACPNEMTPSPAITAEQVLKSLAARRPIDLAVAVVTAHPDDETIGLGGVMAHLRNLTLLQLTDGAPLDPAFAAAAGFPTRQAYAAARRSELVDALAVLVEGRVARQVFYEIPDGRLADHLDVAIERLVEDLIWVDAVLTHPYEGGHFDHDAAAFAVQEACRQLARRGDHTPARLEFTSYHHIRGRLRTGHFVDHVACPEIVVPLLPEAARRKEAAFACHRSQASNLAAFGYGPERFRPAPTYDFFQPPAGGEVMYGIEVWHGLQRAFASAVHA
ncbi:PIG-L deacetylase family protein [Methylobacterium nodulans]|uniref:LmbE family protein n=1 Tax=Methylobacterium nodulans (strain LMG 21967 / CNCM I-2342 / ORS 2060) TaxID=460265 RepID=B8IXN3_METNO|nr:PIG-L family deacetylase [Methylobacterium nodulans]ACL62865.1 LmbE family protein [Methylobacterium nodulans ORS 2060]